MTELWSGATARVGRFAIAAGLVSCASSTRSFETSTQEPDQDPRGTIVANDAPSVALPRAESPTEDVVRRFAVALSTGSGEQLSSVLRSDAIVRERASSKGTPALKALLDLAATPPPSTKATPVGTAAAPRWDQGKIVELGLQRDPPHAVLRIPEPPELRGDWYLLFDPELRPPRIAEVVLPER